MDTVRFQITVTFDKISTQPPIMMHILSDSNSNHALCLYIRDSMRILHTVAFNVKGCREVFVYVLVKDTGK